MEDRNSCIAGLLVFVYLLAMVAALVFVFPLGLLLFVLFALWMFQDHGN